VLSEYAVSVKYKVGIAGVDESIVELQSLLSSVQKGIGIIGQLDYTWMAWTRAAKEFNIHSFLSVTLSTISVMKTLISAIQAATAAQHALNAAMTAGKLAGTLAGVATPLGWLTAGIGLIGTVAAIGYALTAPSPPPTPMSPEAEKAYLLERYAATLREEFAEYERRKRQDLRTEVPD